MGYNFRDGLMLTGAFIRTGDNFVRDCADFTRKIIIHNPRMSISRLQMQ